jgi:hypothetical protein
MMMGGQHQESYFMNLRFGRKILRHFFPLNIVQTFIQNFQTNVYLKIAEEIILFLGA